MFAARPLTFVNGLVIGPDGRLHNTLRIWRGIVDALGRAPERGDAVVDVDGAVILPGLINAHDHLELNSFPRLKWRSRYVNVREWIADFQPRFGCDPQLAAARRDTLVDRVLVGGLKNLLAGVTTVCHHNPLHAALRRCFPVRVVRQFGLSHSIQIDGVRVAESYRRTPAHWPWIIHAAEGVDAEARDEIDTLDRMSCLGANTVLVHGVGLDAEHTERVLESGGALVWCPSSNDFLFGRTANVRRFDQAGRLALGTDSRLSGEGDLLDELRVAVGTRQLSAERLVRTVTVCAASVLRLNDVGRLQLGAPADVVVLRRVASDPYESVVAGRRTNVRLTMVAGAPLIADTAMQTVFEARRQPFVTAKVDGADRLLARWVARRVARLRLSEPGLELVA
jgi:cytosine/adenosine deaminase-related metal-dependent hydrolase